MQLRKPILALLSAFALPVAAQQYADTIYFNGRITTMWDSQPSAEAFAVRGNQFVAVGTEGEIRKLAGPDTRQVNLQGRGVLPGLIDSHTHPISAALSEKDAPIPTIRSIAELQEHLRQLAAKKPKDAVIVVPKVYASRLKERRYPTRYELDEAAPGRIILLDTGYNAVLSSAALEKLGITKETPQPHNGRIIRDDRGEPTGLIIGAAQVWTSLRPSDAVTEKDRLWALKSMQESYNKVGITSTIDRGQNAEGFRIYQKLHRDGGITVRTNLTYRISGAGTPEDMRKRIESIPLITGFGDEWVRVGALKVVADGGILLGTAYLREPYGDHTEVYGWKDPTYRGELSVPLENLTAMAKTANRLGWQMTVHTTGGGATDLLLEAYEAANSVSPIRERRFTVTHGNFPDERAIERARKLGVAFDVQPAWHHFDGPALKPVFGKERLDHFLPLRSLFDAGIVVGGGSDHMIRFDSVEAINPYNPFFGMWMAITRKTADGGVLNPEQAVTREEALRMWTLNGAWMSFEEDIKGSIEPGKLADFVVVSKDYATCAIDEIKSIEALLTVVDGKAVYKAEAF